MVFCHFMFRSKSVVLDLNRQNLPPANFLIGLGRPEASRQIVSSIRFGDVQNIDFGLLG